MYLRAATIRNFRMHLETSISFDRTTTVIVGRNNSGKSSVAELFRKFFGDAPGRASPQFTLDDVSSAKYGELLRSARSTTDDEGGRVEPPAIELELTISYVDEQNDLSAITDFIVDLDDDCTETKVLLRYARSASPRGEGFYDELPENDNEALELLDERLRETFEVIVEAIDPTDAENRTERPLTALIARVQLSFIDAARPMEGDRYREPDTLGRLLATLFDASRKDEKDGSAVAIEKGVAEAEKEINELFGARMKGNILPSFAPLGYPLLSDGELETRTTFDTRQLLRQNTKLYYGSNNGVGSERPLPEGHNGLGLRNLIYILLQLHAFHESRRSAPVYPPVCVLFLEEPEAHLHPQLEEIFIRKVMEVHDKLCGNERWPLQIVVTTHSSHIANEVPFERIRYFLRTPSPCEIQWVSAVKDLGEFSGDVTTKSWLTQYLTLTRCDLYFADKVVLIEGAAERLLLPAFIKKADEEAGAEGQPLTAQYLTVVEVDGRHAHKFYPLLGFIGVPTLIITDLDAEALLPAKKGGTNKDGTIKKTWQKSLVCLGEKSGNPCINAWFDNASLKDLLAKPSAKKEKTDGTLMRIAFQIPEHDGAPSARSFEEALILANDVRWPVPEEIGDDTDKLEEWADALAKSVGKTGLALDLIEEVSSEGFITPKYIREGLVWLRRVGELVEETNEAVNESDATGSAADLVRTAGISND